MKIIIKILLTIIYPFWFLFALTMFGNMLLFIICISPIPILLHIINPNIMNNTEESAKNIGQGVGILSLICSPFFIILFMKLSSYLKNKYENYNYKTELNNQW